MGPYIDGVSAVPAVVRVLSSVAFVLSLIGCAEVPEPIKPGQSIALEAKGGWTKAELATLQGACDEWRTFTDGKLDCVVVPEGQAADARLVRGPSGARTGGYARLYPLDGEIRIDADALATEGFTLEQGLGAITRNAIGLSARIPEHDGDGVMGTSSMAPHLTDADRVVCRSAGFCR